MDSLDLIKLYSPLLFSFVLIYIFFAANFSDEPYITLNKDGYDIKITNNILGKIGIFILFLSSLFSYATFDYSKYFPDRLQMEVFHDLQGINESLTFFSEKDLKRIGFSKLNSKQGDEYFKVLDEKIKRVIGYESFFGGENPEATAIGETSFIVEKTGIFHKYKIIESEGKLEHSKNTSNNGEEKVLSYFQKKSSSNDYIRPSFKDIVFHQEILIKPEFLQTVAEHQSSTQTNFDHRLIGATKVYLIPYPHFSNTVYFYRSKNEGAIPVGYAVYK